MFEGKLKNENVIDCKFEPSKDGVVCRFECLNANIQLWQLQSGCYATWDGQLPKSSKQTKIFF